MNQENERVIGSLILDTMTRKGLPEGMWTDT